MIAKGTPHANGSVLARYLVTGKDGERAELSELRGFAASGIVDAFRSVHVMARGTKCEAPSSTFMYGTPKEKRSTA